MNSYFVIKIGAKYLCRGRLVKRMSQAQVFTDSVRDDGDYVYADANDCMRMQLQVIPVIVETRTIIIVKRTEVERRRKGCLEHRRKQRDELQFVEPTHK